MKHLFSTLLCLLLMSALHSKKLHAIMQPNGEINWPRISVIIDTDTGDTSQTTLRGNLYDSGRVSYGNNNFYFAYGKDIAIYNPVTRQSRTVTVEKSITFQAEFDQRDNSLVAFVYENSQTILFKVNTNSWKFTFLGKPELRSLYYKLDTHTSQLTFMNSRTNSRASNVVTFDFPSLKLLNNGTVPSNFSASTGEFVGPNQLLMMMYEQQYREYTLGIYNTKDSTFKATYQFPFQTSYKETHFDGINFYVASRTELYTFDKQGKYIKHVPFRISDCFNCWVEKFGTVE
jgi:hypothetical protein